MRVSERIDQYLSEARTKDVKNIVKTALDKMKFPYKTVTGTKEDIEVIPNETDSTSEQWNKLEKTLGAIVSKLTDHGMLNPDVSVTLQLENLNESQMKHKIEDEVEKKCNCDGGISLDPKDHDKDCPAQQIFKHYGWDK